MQEDRELVAPVAVCPIAVAQRGADRSGDPHGQLVTGRVSQGVVEEGPY
jgi:hypothetical protein